MKCVVGLKGRRRVNKKKMEKLKGKRENINVQMLKSNVFLYFFVFLFVMFSSWLRKFNLSFIDFSMNEWNEKGNRITIKKNERKLSGKEKRQ